MKEIYETAQEAETIAEREVILKEYGLRNVEVGWPWAMQTFFGFSLGMSTLLQNVFWKLNNTDVYAAVSWDRLHAYHGGLFSDHLWVRFKEIVTALGRSFCEKFDTQ